MGSGSFDAGAYRAYTATTKDKTTDAIYSSRSMNKNLDPKGVKLREKLERIAPVIYAAIVGDGSMRAHSFEKVCERSIRLSRHMIRECERVAREESKKP